uniref:Uncharacterized protein n=1 Tax=viral metagenome TaxID=1070528 RepID=A0A6M3LJY5_9ZZZZ
MSTLKRTNPSGVNVRAITAPGTAGAASAVQVGFKTVRIPFSAVAATSTSNAGYTWINPEDTQIACDVNLVWTTAGTGTCDVGTSSDGTGSNDDILDGATMALGVIQAQGADATLGARDNLFLLAGKGTSGDSIVGKHSDTTTSTAVGCMVIKYFLVN